MTTPPPRRRAGAAVAWAAVALYAGLIFCLSSQENPLPQLTERLSDKVLHGVEYGVLGALLVAALRLTRVGPRAALIGAVALASLYGASDELHQAYVPGRLSDPRDWTADTVGAAIGAGAASALRRSRARASIAAARTR